MRADRIGACRLAVDSDQCDTCAFAVGASLLRRHDAEQSEPRCGFRSSRHGSRFGGRRRAEEPSQVTNGHDIPDCDTMRRRGRRPNRKAEHPEHGSGRNQGPDHEC